MVDVLKRHQILMEDDLLSFAPFKLGLIVISNESKDIIKGSTPTTIVAPKFHAFNHTFPSFLTLGWVSWS